MGFYYLFKLLSFSHYCCAVWVNRVSGVLRYVHLEIPCHYAGVLLLTRPLSSLSAENPPRTPRRGELSGESSLFSHPRSLLASLRSVQFSSLKTDMEQPRAQTKKRPFPYLVLCCYLNLPAPIRLLPSQGCTISIPGLLPAACHG